MGNNSIEMGPESEAQRRAKEEVLRHLDGIAELSGSLSHNGQIEVMERLERTRKILDTIRSL